MRRGARTPRDIAFDIRCTVSPPYEHPCCQARIPGTLSSA
jgi:hypothetical protein